MTEPIKTDPIPSPKKIQWSSALVPGITLLIAVVAVGVDYYLKMPPAPTVQVLSLPTSIQVDTGKMFKIEATTTHKGKVRWIQPPGESDYLDYAVYPDHIRATANAKGVYYLGADLTDNAVDVQWTRIEANLGPKPPPPIPPVPPVPPTPPNPPTPSDPPIAGDGLRVLIIYNSKAEDKLTKGQQDVIFGSKFRTYINSAVVMGPDGKTPERRIWPEDIQAGDEDKKWINALKRPRTASPWLIVSNGKTGYEGPLVDEDSTVKKIDSFK